MRKGTYRDDNEFGRFADSLRSAWSKLGQNLAGGGSDSDSARDFNEQS